MDNTHTHTHELHYYKATMPLLEHQRLRNKNTDVSNEYLILEFWLMRYIRPPNIISFAVCYPSELYDKTLLLLKGIFESHNLSKSNF